MKSFARSPKNDHVPSLPEQVGMILIGVFAGGLAVAFHAVINLAEKTREQLAVLADSHSLAAEIGIMLACGLLAATAVGMVRLIAPEAEGSGIAAVLVAHRTVSPRRATCRAKCAPSAASSTALAIAWLSIAVASRSVGDRGVDLGDRGVDLGDFRMRRL